MHEDINSNGNVKWIAISVLAVIIVLVVVFFLPKTKSSPYKNLDVFAKCLTEKGAKMYGAYWCAHCKNQKALFGEAFQYVKYVECTENAKECETAGVQSYPTWIFKNGNKLGGELSFETLAKESECVLEKK